MVDLFTALFLLSLLGLIIGWNKPCRTLMWLPSQKRTRHQALNYFGPATALLFVLVSVTALPSDANDQAVKKTGAESPQQAVQMAQNYLSDHALSKNGLIKKLKDEGFSYEDATYASDHISVDWKQEAIEMAQLYMDLDPISRKKLMRHLTHAGFSQRVAAKAANEVGLEESFILFQ